MCWGDLENFRTILNVSNLGHLLHALPMEHIWTMLMHKILQNHLLCEFENWCDSLYPESFCDKNLANRKVFAFFDTGHHGHGQWSMVIKVVINIIIVTHLPFGTARPPPVQIKSIINELIIYLLMIFDRYPLDLY